MDEERPPSLPPLMTVFIFSLLESQASRHLLGNGACNLHDIIAPIEIGLESGNKKERMAESEREREKKKSGGAPTSTTSTFCSRHLSLSLSLRKASRLTGGGGGGAPLRKTTSEQQQQERHTTIFDKQLTSLAVTVCR